MFSNRQKLKKTLRIMRNGLFVFVAFLMVVLYLYAPLDKLGVNLSFKLAKFQPEIKEAQAAAPTFQAAGTVASSTGAVTPAWPAHQTNDIALLIVISANQTISLSAPAGFVEVTNSPQGTGSAGGGDATRLAVFWARATSGSMASPTIADPGDHVLAQILTFRGVITTGDPWDVTVGNVAAASSTSVSIPTVTTTVVDTFIVNIVSNNTDIATARTSGWTNTNLTSLTERADANTSLGNGGGFGAATGIKSTVGATGATTATLSTTSRQGRITIALKPPVANIPPTANAGSDQAITLPTNSVTISGASGSDSDGTISSESWTFQSGPPTPTITDGTGFTPTFSGLITAGTYVFRLTVTDNLGATGWDEMSVVVSAAASPPSGNNVSGFAWSENIGWISFNSKNCDANLDGFSDGTPTGCPSAGTSIYQYGVNIDASGDFTAGSYAWNEYLGAIDFNPAGPYPGTGLPNYPARLDWGTGLVSGWARACNVFQTGCSGTLKADSERGGWDGWIKLRKDAADGGASYGVYKDSSGDFHDFAWGSDVVGWISFNCAEGSFNEGTGVRGSICATSNYKVSITNPPVVRNIQAPSIDYCSAKAVFFQWEYFDLDGQTESSFEFQVDNNSDFSSPNYSRSYSSLSLPSPSTQNQTVMLSTAVADNTCVGCNRIGYNSTTYYWRVRVCDSSGACSSASPNPSFTTLLHAYPEVTSISYSPSVPSANENVSFSAVTVCYNTSGPIACPSGTAGSPAPNQGYHWSFSGGNPVAADGSTTPTTLFTSAGAASASLQVIDSDGYGQTCSAQGTVSFRIQLPLPGWKEVSP